jgi:hypothetical protein
MCIDSVKLTVESLGYGTSPHPIASLSWWLRAHEGAAGSHRPAATDRLSCRATPSRAAVPSPTGLGVPLLVKEPPITPGFRGGHRDEPATHHSSRLHQHRTPSRTKRARAAALRTSVAPWSSGAWPNTPGRTASATCAPMRGCLARLSCFAASSVRNRPERETRSARRAWRVDEDVVSAVADVSPRPVQRPSTATGPGASPVLPPLAVAACDRVRRAYDRRQNDSQSCRTQRSAGPCGETGGFHMRKSAALKMVRHTGQK